MYTILTIKKQNFYNQICITKNWFKDLQNDVNQFFKSVHHIDVSF